MRRALLAAVVFLIGCAGAGAGPRPLRPLDAEHAADLRRLFDEARDRPRYIAALSPT